MRCRNFTFRKKQLLAFFTFVIISSFSNLYSQTLTIDPACTMATSPGGCATFSNTCNSSSGWTSSHGSPEIKFWYNFKGYDHYYALMIGGGNGVGEGMFKPFSFIAGQTYTITVTFSTTGDPGTLTLYAANNLAQQFNVCQGTPQINNSKQLIGQVANGVPFTFTCNATYNQFWMYASLTMGAQYNVAVTNITIVPVCNLSAPTGLGISNNGNTLNWNAVTGASSYKINVNDTHNGILTIQTFSSNTNTINYCPQGAGDNVTFIVNGICGNSGEGQSSQYSYTFNGPSPVKPTGLNATNITSTSAILTWTAQPGISFNGSVYGPTGASFSTTTNSYTLTGLIPNSNYSWYVSAYNNCTATGSTSSSFATLPACSSPAAPYGQTTSNGIYIVLPTTPAGCISYNLKYRIYGTTQEYIISNIPTTTSYFLTNVVHGNQYQFSLQSNCSAGISSLYGPWSQTPTYYSPTYYYRTGPPSGSDAGKNSFTDSTHLVYHQDSSFAKTNSTDLFLYPNPTANAITISFENKEMAKPELVIVNSLGKEIYRKYLANENSKGIQYQKINVSKISNGVYIFKLKLGTKVLIQKLIIQR